jgi:hypothetical protein
MIDNVKRLIESAEGRTFYNARKPFAAERLPGLNTSEIDVYRQRAGGVVSADFERLLRFARGMRFGPFGLIDFTGGSHSFSMENLLPCGVALAADGYGNFWVADLDGESGSCGPVFFCSHDPPVLMIAATSLDAFLRDLFDTSCEDLAKFIKKTHEQVGEIRLVSSGGMPSVDARTSNDREIAEFAEKLSDGAFIFDLRHASKWHGFPWALRTASDELSRDGSRLLFAVKPETPKRAWWRSLFSGSPD